jgi:hypothetical protein
MFSNPDWDMAERRLAAFWKKEIIDRPCLQVYADTPADTASAEAEREDAPAERYWTDPLAFLRANRRRYAHTAYLGEALPVLYPNAEHVALAMGSALRYDTDTIWIRPSPGGLSELDFSHVTQEHPTIRAMAAYFERLAAAAQRECFVGFPHMGNAGDTLARMRGYENYCIEIGRASCRERV